METIISKAMTIAMGVVIGAYLVGGRTLVWKTVGGLEHKILKEVIRPWPDPPEFGRSVARKR